MFHKKIFLFFLAFPLFFLEIHFSFKESRKTSFISVKQAFSDNNDSQEGASLSIEDSPVSTTQREPFAYEPNYDQDYDLNTEPTLTPTKPSSPNQTEITARAKPSKTKDTTASVSSLSPINPPDNSKNNKENEKLVCGDYDDEGIYDLSPKKLKSEIKGVERKANSIKENARTITIPLESGGKETIQKYNTEAADACYKIKDSLEDALENATQCEEELETAQKTRTEVSKDCSQFSGGTFQCFSAIKACANCPDKADYGDYDCVKIHNKTKCPALSGQELKAAKEKRDKVNEEIEKFQEKIKDLEEEIISKENELYNELSELEEEFTEANQGN